MVRHLRFRHIKGDEVVESDLITCFPGEWEALPEARDPSWAVWRGADLVCALRLPDALPVLGTRDFDRPGAGESRSIDVRH